MATRVVARSPFASLQRRFIGARRRKIDTGAACFGKSDCDGLFCGARAVLTASDMLYLLADEFAGLCRRSLTRFAVRTGSIECLLLWHAIPNVSVASVR